MQRGGSGFRKLGLCSDVGGLGLRGSDEVLKDVPCLS